MIITQASYFDLPHEPQADKRESAQLRPWALLHRLRPVQVAAIRAQLRYCQWAVAGLHLIEKYFPETLEQYGDLSRITWWDILVDLGHMVEGKDWFEFDWHLLNEAWAHWLEHPTEDGEYLAAFLQYIPVKLYGFNREPASGQLFNAEPGLFIEFFPPAELLYVLLDPAAEEISSGLLVGAELYDRWDGWDEAGRERAWERLHRIEVEPEAYPDPVRRLPALARWACGTTDNPILKWSFSTYTEGGGESFCWETDVDRVRLAWLIF